MAAHACCGVAAPAAARRLKLTRSSSLMKARKLRKTGGGTCRPRSAAARRKRVVAVRRKMEALRRLVPACGGRDGDSEQADDGGRLEELLLHAAAYILRLQMQVRVMQVMVHALNNNNPED